MSNLRADVIMQKTPIRGVPARTGCWMRNRCATSRSGPSVVTSRTPGSRPSLGSCPKSIARAAQAPRRASSSPSISRHAARSNTWQLPRRDVKVVEFGKLGPPDQLLRVLDRQLRSGAYMVLPPEPDLVPIIKLILSPNGYESWDIDRGGAKAFTIYHARRDGDVASRLTTGTGNPPARC